MTPRNGNILASNSSRNTGTRKALRFPWLAPVLALTAATLLGLPSIAVPQAATGASALDRVCVAEAAWDDATEAAHDDVPADVKLAYDQVPTGPTAVVLGASHKFDTLVFNIGLPGTGSGSVLWKYWNGVTYVRVTVDDGTDGFRQDGSVTFTPPDDWEKKVISPTSCPGNYHYIRIITSQPYLTKPLADQVLKA